MVFLARSPQRAAAITMLVALGVLVLSCAREKAELPLGCIVIAKSGTTISAADLAFDNTIQHAGFRTTFIVDSELSLDACEMTCDALIYSASSLGSFGAIIASCNKPVLTWEEGFARSTAMTGPSVGIDAGNAVEGAVILGTASDNTMLFDGPQDMSWANVSSLGSGATIIATSAAHPTRAVAYFYCPGDLMYGGVRAPSLRLHLPPHYFPVSPALQWTGEGEAMRDSAVQALLRGVKGSGTGSKPSRSSGTGSTGSTPTGSWACPAR